MSGAAGKKFLPVPKLGKNKNMNRFCVYFVVRPRGIAGIAVSHRLVRRCVRRA
jgi:hypothetical protein